MSNAATYWKIQGHTPPPRQTGFAGMSAPYQRWPLLEMTPADLEWGKQQLTKVRASGNLAPDRNFGNKSAGFAAERVVDRWLTERGIPHTWDDNPKSRLPDFEIYALTIDLKTHITIGEAQPSYDANLTEEQRIKSGPRDWYLFAKLDRSNMTDLWLLGFQTLKSIMTKGVFYRKGEMTRAKVKMEAPVDCWCIAYEELIKPPEWLEKYNEKEI